MLSLVELQEGNSEVMGSNAREIWNADIDWEDRQSREPEEAGSSVQQFIKTAQEDSRFFQLEMNCAFRI